MKIIFKYSRAAAGLVLCAVLLTGCKDSTSVLKSGGNDELGSFVTSEEEISEKNDKTSDTSEDEQIAEDARQTKQIYVDVQGAVQTPGVYQLPEGSRVFQAIDAAGGLTGEAAVELVNQAGVLEDGQQIHIFTKEEAEEIQKERILINGNCAPNEETGMQPEGKVNINQADKETLMTLNGVGETRAEAILAYREANGGFSCVEDLMQVDGIKGKTYEKLKDQITVD